MSRYSYYASFCTGVPESTTRNGQIKRSSCYVKWLVFEPSLWPSSTISSAGSIAPYLRRNRVRDYGFSTNTCPRWWDVACPLIAPPPANVTDVVEVVVILPVLLWAIDELSKSGVAQASGRLSSDISNNYEVERERCSMSIIDEPSDTTKWANFRPNLRHLMYYCVQCGMMGLGTIIMTCLSGVLMSMEKHRLSATSVLPSPIVIATTHPLWRCNRSKIKLSADSCTVASWRATCTGT